MGTFGTVCPVDPVAPPSPSPPLPPSPPSPRLPRQPHHPRFTPFTPCYTPIKTRYTPLTVRRLMTKVMKYFHFLFGIPSLTRAMLICTSNDYDRGFLIDEPILFLIMYDLFQVPYSPLHPLTPLLITPCYIPVTPCYVNWPS